MRDLYQREIAWYLSPRRWLSLQRLALFENRHRGERCFIIGNGPSLRQMDLRPLRDEYTFGLNRIYLLFADLGFPTTYLVVSSKYVMEQCAAEIGALTLPKFLPWKAQQYVPFDRNTMLLRTNGRRPCFARNLRHWLWEGHTVTYVAMQIAFFMGFSQVILIGVDHHFETRGESNKLVVMEGADPNHFSPHYFYPGFRWQLPDLEQSERAYTMARAAYRQDGREIVDATVGGRLQIFPKVAYADLFPPRSVPQPSAPEQGEEA